MRLLSTAVQGEKASENTIVRGGVENTFLLSTAVQGEKASENTIVRGGVENTFLLSTAVQGLGFTFRV